MIFGQRATYNHNNVAMCRWRLVIATLEATDYELPLICGLLRRFAVGQLCPSRTGDLINDVVRLTRQTHSEHRSNVFNKAAAIAFVCGPLILAGVDDLLCTRVDRQEC